MAKRVPRPKGKVNRTAVYHPPRKTVPRRKGRKAAPGESWTKENRLDEYARISHLAVRSGETDSLIRNLMAAGLARGDGGPILTQDLTLLRWTLHKMELNRRAAEIEACGIGGN